MDIRQIRRLAYDGNYQRAIEMLLDILEKQDKRIKQLEEKDVTLNKTSTI